MADNILPCPFCKMEDPGVIDIESSWDARVRVYQVRCWNCMARGAQGDNSSVAIAAWNAAPRPEPALSDKVKREIQLAAEALDDAFAGQDWSVSAASAAGCLALALSLIKQGPEGPRPEPARTCVTCKWWSDFHEICNRPVRATYPTDEGRVGRCGSDFGCINHERKEAAHAR